jgi:hypothetical protein
MERGGLKGRFEAESQVPFTFSDPHKSWVLSGKCGGRLMAALFVFLGYRVAGHA